ncbi:MAG TPA: pirin family protein [Candidatus Acidoferrum sp.]|nr:pirin family protein [Candidatus Acidoferrum sp.]
MKRILSIERGPAAHWVGDGFPVRTIFTFDSLGYRISPFLLLDYAGPREFPPADTPRGVDEHPHRGFETVTILYQGELEHRDSAGNHGSLGPGDVQWMTAASGVVHEEKHSGEFTRRGGTLEMVQLWVNLPAKYKMNPPSYQTLSSRQIPVAELPGGAGTLRVIAGEFGQIKGPARTFTPINLWDVRLKAGHRGELALPRGYTTALFVLHGELGLVDSERAGATDLVLLTHEGDRVPLEARADTTLLVLNGAAIDEPVAMHGPFVMNSPSEITQAIEDYHRGRLGKLAA